VPRSHRRRPDPSGSDESFDRLLAGWKRTETRRGREWTVQPISAMQALKEYRCPGCDQVIAAGTGHVVTWPAGEHGSVADRRHWHTACWSHRLRRRPGGRRR
jgi:4'-phosphopantetheinyl transferase EntD